MYPSDVEINVLLMRDLLVSRKYKRRKVKPVVMHYLNLNSDCKYVG